MSDRAARAIAVASDAEIGSVAVGVLSRGNAADAVISAVFAAAAVSPGVLLGPVQMIVGGAGAGLRAVDGRTQQPGRGLSRPRGFLPTDPIAPAARVAAPVLPAALATALAAFGSQSLARTMGPAAELSRGLSKPRAEALRQIAQRGPAALTDTRFSGELVAAAGRVAGGLLTAKDLEELRPVVAACKVVTEGSRRTATVPWGGAAVRASVAEVLDGHCTRIVAAVDRHGLIAVAVYEQPLDGLAIAELDLLAPFSAAPVLRGQARVRPGTPRQAAAPIALGEASGVLELGAGMGGERDAERVLHEWLHAHISGGVAVAPPGHIGRRVIGVLRAGNHVRAIG